MEASDHNLPIVRSHERMTYKRCAKRWYWSWRMGLVPRAAQFGALELGTWIHQALAAWYVPGRKRRGHLVVHFSLAAERAIKTATVDGAPEHVLDKAYELFELGKAMCLAYEARYGRDEKVNVIRAEIPLEFTISDPVTGKLRAVHRLKPDLVYMDENRDVWLMEHKTAASIRTGHLVIDDQARPYGAMAEPALRKLGAIPPNAKFKGIMYNFLRKALPDEREYNAEGKALNKNGTVSKRQPPVNFLRPPVYLSNKAKAITLRRVQNDTVEITDLTLRLRRKEIDPMWLRKTQHTSCTSCQFFTMCTAEEDGTDIRGMMRDLYIRRDPYVYDEDTTDDPPSFEMG